MTDPREPSSRFFALASSLFERLEEGESAGLGAAGERTSFVRFNRGLVRDPGEVHQTELTLTLTREGRQAEATTSVPDDDARAARLLVESLRSLRGWLEHLPEDPYLAFDDAPREEVHVAPHHLPSAREACDAILEAAGGEDLVGILASGTFHRGFASSVGHRLWHEGGSYTFDYSLYAEGDKAAKGCHARREYDADALVADVRRTAEKLPLLRREPKRVPPGRYRTYLAPAALGRLLDLLSWDGFSARAQMGQRSALTRLADGTMRLSPKVHIAEDGSSGLSPPFFGLGFLRPSPIPLVDSGEHAGALVSPRTARELGVAPNAADEEQPTSLIMGSGGLAEEDVLERLGEGLYITDLWYTNYSDQMAARITGMTRFATAWVEGGELAQPLEVMRFDDTLDRILGECLEALDEEPTLLPDAGSYGSRSLDASRVPGALLTELELTR